MQGRKLRRHQKEIIRIAEKIRSRNDKEKYTIYAHVVPSGGKSWMPLLLKEQFPTLPLYWFVPRENLRNQAAVVGKQDFGLDLRESGNEYDPLRGYAGCISSHQALTSDPNTWYHATKLNPGILCGDEGHHFLYRKRSGKLQPTARAFDRLDYKIRLIMTGTLENNEGKYLYGLKYK